MSIEIPFYVYLKSLNWHLDTGVFGLSKTSCFSTSHTHTRTHTHHFHLHRQATWISRPLVSLSVEVPHSTLTKKNCICIRYLKIEHCPGLCVGAASSTFIYIFFLSTTRPVIDESFCCRQLIRCLY